MAGGKKPEDTGRESPAGQKPKKLHNIPQHTRKVIDLKTNQEKLV